MNADTELALPWLAGHPPVHDKYDVAESRICVAIYSKTSFLQLKLKDRDYFEIPMVEK